MPSLMAIFEPSLPAHCEPSGWFFAQFSRTFHTCIPTPLAFVSTLLGCLSIASWLFAQMPQIYKNWTLHSTSGLSIFFLVEWLLGDLTNLLGCIFTQQATWQVVLATYYCTVDVVLCGQWMWYEHLQHGRPWRKAVPAEVPQSWSPERRTRSQEMPEMARTPSKPIQLPSMGMFRMPRFSFSPSSWKRNGDDEMDAPSGRTISRSGQGASFMGVSPRTVLYTTTILTLLFQSATASPLQHQSRPLIAIQTRTTESPSQIAGRLFSWFSTLLYLGSRMPQLYKNHARKSTSGLSPHLFIAAFFGNLFYSSSILTNPCAWSDYPPYGGRGWADKAGSSQAVWISKAIPFWLGAAGVLTMDAAVGVQFLIYGEGDSAPAKPAVVVEEEDNDGRHIKRPWRRASGWMRGWYPSVSVAGTPRPGTPTSFFSSASLNTEEAPLLRGEANLGEEVARWEERQRLLAASEGTESRETTPYGSI